MSLREETVRRVAELARLALSDSEVSQFTGQLSQILGYVDQLQAVNTAGVEPMVSGLTEEGQTFDGTPRPAPGSEVMTACAPAAHFGSFQVPPVIGGG